MSIITRNQITIIDVQDGSEIVEQYASNTSETVAPTSGWQSIIPAPQAGYYVWMRKRREYADGTVDAWGTAVRITGDPGGNASYIVEQDAHIFIFDSDFTSNKLLSPAQPTDAYIVELEHERHDKVVTLSEGETWLPIKDKTWSEL